jgi:hypothetical protein
MLTIELFILSKMWTFRFSPIRSGSANVLLLRTGTIFASNTQVRDELLIYSVEEFERLSAIRGTAQRPQSGVW